MIFKRRPGVVHNQLPLIDLGRKYLVVSGCSFTYNNSETAASTWPYIFKSLGGFDEVLDCSLPGGGNYHISNSLIWGLVNEKPDPDDTLVVVMWSGNDRDDCMMSSLNLNDYPMSFYYSNDAVSGITGGFTDQNSGNCKQGIDVFRKIKSEESRAIENYLYMLQLHTWLSANGYRFVFVDYLDRTAHRVNMDFDIDQYLPDSLAEHKRSMMAPVIDLYSHAKNMEDFYEDGFHPGFNANLSWVTDRLIPYIKTLDL